MKLNRSGAAMSAAGRGRPGAVLRAAATAESTSAESDAAKVECGGKQSLTASGSTAQANAMTRFVEAYEKACSGQTLSYTANGSGAGIREFTSGKTDFGGTDIPLSKEDAEYAAARQRCGSDPWNLPTVFGPVAISYNINAVDTLVLDAPTLAKIFNGTITKWNDPAITQAEPVDAARGHHRGVPQRRIRNHARRSRTTWRPRRTARGARARARTFKGGVGKGGEGNEGTAATVKNTEGAITYNEWSFAQAQNLVHREDRDPGDRDPVGISPESVGKTIAGAKVNATGNDLALDTSSFYKPTEAGAYPIVLATYELVCSKYPDAEVGKAVRAFLQSTIGPGQADLEDNGYMPMPADFQSKVSSAINAIG